MVGLDVSGVGGHDESSDESFHYTRPHSDANLTATIHDLESTYHVLEE
jgi:hypothetical protein